MAMRRACEPCGVHPGKAQAVCAADAAAADLGTRDAKRLRLDESFNGSSACALVPSAMDPQQVQWGLPMWDLVGLPADHCMLSDPPPRMLLARRGDDLSLEYFQHIHRFNPAAMLLRLTSNLPSGSSRFRITAAPWHK